MDQTTVHGDYYEVLGAPKSADQNAIKEVLRKLVLKYHPDRNKSPAAERRFKEIAEAYAVLSDPGKRAEYDARGFAGHPGCRLFRLPGSGAQPGISSRNCDACDGTGRKVVTRQDIKEGGSFRFRHISVCPDCRGSGVAIENLCTTCQGTRTKV